MMFQIIVAIRRSHLLPSHNHGATPRAMTHGTYTNFVIFPDVKVNSLQCLLVAVVIQTEA